MPDIAPDWASQPANVPQTAPTSTAPSWASASAPAPAAAQGGAPAWAAAQPDPNQKASSFGNILQGLHGAYMQAVTNGFGGEPVRMAMEGLGVGMDKLKAEHPGQTDDWYHQQLHQAYNDALVQERQDALTETKENPYPGHQIGNTAATVLGSADPSWFINPGSAMSGGFVKRAAVNAATHAALNSGIDDAYQAADMLEGVQKEYDVNRNLAAAGVGGLFGAAHTGAVEVAPFIKSLFKERGVDTTPGAAPTGENTPYTGASPPPEFVQQYNRVLQTGNEQDIQALFKDKNIPAPSFEDTHNFVKQRDAKLAEGTEPVDHTAQIFPQGTPDLRQPVADHIAQHTADWKNAPEFEVINHTDDIQDPEVREQAKAAGADDPEALGFVGQDGKVRIFANKMDSEAKLNSVIYHEALGHYGLQQQFGTGLDNTLNTLMKRNVGQFGKDVDKWQQENPGAYGGDRTRAAEEVLAEMSQKGQVVKSVGDAIVGHLRRFGRQMGMKLSYSDAEVRNIVAMAHNAVINGKGRDVAGNGFKFMFNGPRSQAFDRDRFYDANNRLVAGQDPEAVRQATGTHYADGDAEPRQEIDDSKARLRPMAEGESNTLGNVLHHPALFEHYPQLADVGVIHKDMGPEFDGLYAPKSKVMFINSTAPDKLSTVLHETQHAVQQIEGRSNTAESTAKMSGDDYAKNAMENEARATEARKAQDSIDRRNTTPPKFMRASQLEPKDVAEEAYERLGLNYKPKTRSWEEAAKMAADTPLSPEMVKQSRGAGNLDRKLFIYNNAAKEANDKLVALAAKANTEGGLTAQDHEDLIETANQFHYVLGRLDGDLAQIGRALNAAKTIEFRRGNILALKNALEAEHSPLSPLTDPDTGIKFLKQFAALSAKGPNPNGVATMLKGVSKPYWWQYLLTWRSNMMLSGLSTHLKSTMDMATTAARDMEEKALALPAGVVREGLRGLGVNVKPGVDSSEFAMHLWGMTRAVLDAQTWKDAGDAFVNGGQQRFGGATQNPRIPVVSKVTDAIAAQDSFFRSVLGAGNLYALGARKAKAELIAQGTKFPKFDDITTRGAAHARLPDPSMLDAAKEATENTMLLNKSPLNQGIDKIKYIRPGMTGGEQLGSFLVNYLTPFIRVQSNALMNQIIRRSPLSFLDPVTRSDFAAGGARRDVATARTLLGTFILVNAWNAAAPGNNKITGEGPENANKFKEMQAGGFQPNSVVEKNGTHSMNSNLNISLNPFDLHNNTASLVAGVRDAYEQGKQTHDVATGIKLSMAAIMHDLVSQTFVNDLGEAYDAVSGRGETLVKKVSQFAGNEAKSFLPNQSNQLARIIDPNKHDVTGGIPQQIQAAIPGASKGLPIKYSVYGEPEQTGTTLTGIHTMIPGVPGNHTTDPTDPTIKEMARLAKLTPAAQVTPVQRIIKINGTSIKLEPDQFEDYQKYAGQTIVQGVREQMQSGAWDKMSEAERIGTVRDIQKEAKSQVREALAEKEGWLKSDQLDTLRKAANGQ